MFISVLARLLIAGVPDANCHQGWENYGSKCYKYVSTTKTWNDARAYCQSLGADLASIHSTTEDTFIDNIRTDNQVRQRKATPTMFSQCLLVA